MKSSSTKKLALFILALVLALLLLPACSTIAPTSPTASATLALTATPAAALAEPTPTAGPTPVSGEMSIGDPYLPQLGNTGYDVEQYDLRFALNPLKNNITAEAVIRAHSTLDRLGKISLDFVGFDIQKLTVDGTAAKYSRARNKLVIALPSVKQNSQPFSVDIAYAGKPASPASSSALAEFFGFQFEPDHKDLYTMGEPGGAEYWFPCNDHPRDKAAFQMEITVPKGYQGVANGRLVNLQKDVANAFSDGTGGDRYTWEIDQPTATYLAVVAVGQYTLEEGKTPGGIPLRSYIYPSDRAVFEQAMTSEKVGAALDWMSQKFGPYPFGPFGFVEIGTPDFSMETQSMIMLSDSMLASPNGGEVMVHEMAHMWFGDWVSLDSWADIWRNEGFATYIAALWDDQVHPGSLEQHLKLWRQTLDQQPPDFPLDNPPEGAMFSRASYFEGALLVHDLHQAMGDQAFFQGLQTYFKAYSGRTASEAQFQAEMEKAAGKALDNVFEKWFPPGLPQGQ